MGHMPVIPPEVWLQPSSGVSSSRKMMTPEPLVLPVSLFWPPTALLSTVLLPAVLLLVVLLLVVLLPVALWSVVLLPVVLLPVATQVPLTHDSPELQISPSQGSGRGTHLLFWQIWAAEHWMSEVHSTAGVASMQT